MVFNKSVIGFLGMHSLREYAFSEETADLLRIAGEIFSATLQRRRAVRPSRPSGNRNGRRGVSP